MAIPSVITSLITEQLIEEYQTFSFQCNEIDDNVNA
jgi:hypothetical protein